MNVRLAGGTHVEKLRKQIVIQILSHLSAETVSHIMYIRMKTSSRNANAGCIFPLLVLSKISRATLGEAVVKTVIISAQDRKILLQTRRCVFMYMGEIVDFTQVHVMYIQCDTFPSLSRSPNKDRSDR